MLKILTSIIVAAVVLCVGVVAIAATRPDTFHIERSATIKAPPERIYAVINDFRNWPSWSPWQKLDPDMKVTNSGPVAGKGAVSEWSGNFGRKGFWGSFERRAQPGSHPEPRVRPPLRLPGRGGRFSAM